MNFVFKWLVAKYGMKIGREMYEKFKRERAAKQQREAMKYQRGMKKHWIDDIDY